ncbi:MAG: ribonucleoside-diphosphate reductase subunit alpha [Bacteroidetes bacterium]|nr:MAG: ribonucleoside-diphosphate reductase subunit alpha [Bacteroidota bacterium]
MWPTSSEIARDLALKRATLLPPAERPSFDPARLIENLLPARLFFLHQEGGDVRFDPADLARLVAEAWISVQLATHQTADEERLVPFTRRVVERVLSRLAALPEDARPTFADVVSLAEAVLLETGAVDVAKALVMHRARTAGSGEAAPTAEGLRLIRRNGQVVARNAAKIEVAVRKAFLSRGLDSAPARAIARDVTERAASLGLSYVPIETVQDLVQEALLLAGHTRVAEAYITYRAERAVFRAMRSAPAEQAQETLIDVVEPDGSSTLWDGEELRARIRMALIGLDVALSEQDIERHLRRNITHGISRADLQTTLVLNARALLEKDADFARFAARILLGYIYEETIGWDLQRDGLAGLKAAHEQTFEAYLRRGVEIGRLDPALLEYDLPRLAAALDPMADLDFTYLGLQTLYDRYLLVDKTGATPRRLETPQFFWMRVAMGLFLREPGDREARVIDLYTLYKERRFCNSTPTLFNSGTPHSQLSSCYLYKVDDSIESIMYRGIAENAFLSKWAGGLGGSWTAVRGTGSHIRGTNGESQGVIPFLKLHNDQLVAVNQGGKRAGSGCAYLELWHNDIFDFLELRRNTGDERRRTHDLNTACWIPDLFMQRVEARQHWTLFRSSDVPDLHECYGRAFRERYEHYERLVDEGRLWGHRIQALDLWKQMLRMLFETGHPWMTFKDPCNVRSPQDHAGVIHSSNLCTEITLNTSADETAVCNLGSVVLDRHLRPDGSLDNDKLRETIRIAVRALDNVIDLNFYPTEAARRSNLRHRPIGLGVMGLQYALYERGVSFDSDEAIRFSDEMMEAIAYYAYEASSDLAAERGTYESYAGSKWDRGLLPMDTLDLLEQERGEPIEVERGGMMDWTPLRAKIAAQGMRNSNVLAIAPTATISNIMGTSPCIEPLYRNLYVKSNLSGDFVVLNPYLVSDLKAAGLWDDEMAAQLKYFDGDLTQIDAVPASLRERYRTAFQIPPRALIDAAARRQKWIDQSQSLNLFLAEPDMKTLSHMYRHAWHAGLKTTYYLRTLGASHIEKATVARLDAAAPTAVPREGAGEVAACRLDALLNGGECEACQ